MLEYLKEGLNYLEVENYTEAINLFKESEDLLEKITTQGGVVDQDLVLLTLHNTAAAFQQAGNLQDCVSYLDGCAYNLKNKKIPISHLGETKIFGKAAGEKLRRDKYHAEIQIQLCAVMSQLKKHEKALAHAKTAARLTYSIINETFQVCTSMLQRQKKYGSYEKLKKQKKTKFINQKQFEQLNDLMNKNLYLLEYLVIATGNKIQRANSGKLPKIDMRNVLGVQNQDHWIYHFSVGDIINMKPLTHYSLKKPHGILAEITNDSIFEKICLLITSYFCIGIEIKFLSEQKESPNQLKESKNWVLKAYELAKTLLPKETPIVTHIKESLQRNFKMIDTKNISSNLQKPKADVSLTKRTKSPFRETPGRKIQLKPRASSARPKRVQRKPSFKFSKLVPIQKNPLSKGRLKVFSTKEEKDSQKFQSKKFENDENKELLDIQTEGPEKSKLNDLLSPKPILEDYRFSSDESFDPDYVRENFVISSKALYGDQSYESEEEDEHKPKLPTTQNRICSSTGGKN